MASVVSPTARTAAHAAPTAVHNPIITAPAVTPLVRGFDKSMEKLLSNSEDVVFNAVGLLFKILNNIVLHPMEEKYRKIKSSNASFSAKIHTVKGGTDCMRSVGFTEVNGEWILYPSAEGWDLLVSCKNKLEIFHGKLTKQRAVLESGSFSSPSPHAAPGSAAAPTVPPVDPNAVLAIIAALQSTPQNGDGGAAGPS